MKNEHLLKDRTVLTIRPLVPEDAEAAISYMHLVSAESDYLTFGAGEFSMTVEEERQFIAAASDAPRSVMFGGFIDNHLVSIANLRGEVRPRTQHNCEIGISVLKEFWRNGIGTGMLMALIREATALDMKVIHLLVNIENEPAIRIYEKYGFETVGRYAKYIHLKDRYVDVVLMDLYL